MHLANPCVYFTHPDASAVVLYLQDLQSAVFHRHLDVGRFGIQAATLHINQHEILTHDLSDKLLSFFVCLVFYLTDLTTTLYRGFGCDCARVKKITASAAFSAKNARVDSSV